MCGICGIVDFKGQILRETEIRNMMRTMKHRGPDDEGTFHEGRVHLGFVRLSIIDLTSAGHQPMASVDGRYVIVLNGEIYNYIELREELCGLGHVFRTRTDTEVLLVAYREWGAACLDRLNGMWALAIYDRRERILFCARDRFGVKPFYYHLNEDRLMRFGDPSLASASA
jgi:asparagine synthase (glutamine-hydrolysing)